MSINELHKACFVSERLAGQAFIVEVWIIFQNGIENAVPEEDGESISRRFWLISLGIPLEAFKIWNVVFGCLERFWIIIYAALSRRITTINLFEHIDESPPTRNLLVGVPADNELAELAGHLVLLDGTFHAVHELLALFPFTESFSLLEQYIQRGSVLNGSTARKAILAARVHILIITCLIQEEEDSARLAHQLHDWIEML